MFSAWVARTFTAFLAGALLVATLVSARADKFELSASVAGAFDQSFNPLIPTPDINTNVGFSALYQIDYFVTTNVAELAPDEVGPGVLGFRIDQTDGVTDSMGVGWVPNFPPGDIIVQNGDNIFPPNDLIGIFVTFKPGSGYPAGPIYIGSTFLAWNGLGPATSSTYSVQFAARRTNGSFAPSVSGAGYTISFGAVPEPTSGAPLIVVFALGVLRFQQRN